MNENLEKFKANWGKFVTRLRGQMIAAAKKQKLSYPMLKLMLAEQVGFWDSRYDEGGRWLNEYESANPDKGGMIRKILVEDICFSTEYPKNPHMDILKYAVSFGGGAAGLAISHAMGAGKFAQAVSTVVPAVVAYPVASSLSDSVQDQWKKEMIDFYMDQLEKYKISVEGILEY